MTENTVVQLTRESMNPREFGKRYILFSFLVSPPAIAAFNGASQTWGPTAAYFVLWVWFFLELLALWFAHGFDIVRKLISPSGWYLRDVPLQLLTGMLVAGGIIAGAYVIAGSPSPKNPDLFLVALPLIAFFWFVSVPAETALQAWLWPMSLPFGPVVAPILFAFLHGERAFDPIFLFAAVLLGFLFWVLSFLRYLNLMRRAYRFFGPVAAWSAHATWNSLLIWVALTWPQV